jgi:hypothetical protein
MKTVYAVSRGEYSDYSVMCVCEDEATAIRFRDAYNGGSDCGGARIETMRLFGAGEQPRRITTHRSSATLHDNGGVSDVKYWANSSWQFDPYCDDVPRRPRAEYRRAPVLHNRGGYLCVVGRTAESVAKVTSERIAAFKARAWIPQGEKATP